MVVSQTTWIYGLADPRTAKIRYVGKSDRPERRLSDHLAAVARGETTHKANWLRGIGKPRLVLLECVPHDLWPERERFWIDQYADLTNLSQGGEGNNGWVAPPETRERMSEAAKRAGQDPMLRAKRSENSKKLGLKPPVHKGEQNSKATLTDPQVKTLREEAAHGATGIFLSNKYGISTSCVVDLLSGRVRKEAGGPTRPSQPRTKLSDADVDDIRRLLLSGEQGVTLAKRYGVSQPLISKIAARVRRNRR